MTATTTGQPIASRIHRIGLHVLLGAVALQLALAGGGAFGAPAWSMHVMLGMLITALAALVVVAALVARPGRTLLLGTLFVGVLALLQPLLSVLAQRVDPWFGILHAIAAVGMIAVPAVLIASRRPDRRATA
jgi:hypothetical protein